MKSKIGFGHYKDYTVSDLIAIGRETELIQIYFNLEKVSFTEDILEKLGVTRIEKPGKRRDWATLEKQKFWNRKNEGRPLQEVYKEIAHVKKSMKITRNLRNIERNFDFVNKTTLQRVNHGHKYQGN